MGDFEQRITKLEIEVAHIRACMCGGCKNRFKMTEERGFYTGG